MQLQLQARHAGFRLDDFVVHVQPSSGTQRAKLHAQVKHHVAFATSDRELPDVIKHAWLDFNDASFDPQHDALALITGPLNVIDTQHVRPLMEWARHSATAQEFTSKVANDGFSSNEKRVKLSVLHAFLNRANDDKPISDEQLWSFLKAFHLLGYDLDVASGSTHALLLNLISQASTTEPVLAWSQLVNATQNFNQNAGTVTTETLPQAVRDLFSRPPHWPLDTERLRQHGQLVLQGVRQDVDGVHVPRDDLLARLHDLVQREDFVWIGGPRGVGKSSLLRSFAEQVDADALVVCLRAQDLNQPSLTQVFTSLGVRSSLHELDATFALLPKKYLLIESFERILEFEAKGAVRDLMQFVQASHGWTIVASGRDYALQQLKFSLLEPMRMSMTPLLLGGFDAAQINHLCSDVEALRPVAARSTLRPLLSIPFFAELAVRAVREGASFEEGDGEEAFRSAVWRYVIEKVDVRVAGMPARRRDTFIRVALERAKRMVYAVPETPFDAEVIDALEADQLLTRDLNARRVSPAHDVFEDWALEAHIEEARGRHADDVRAFLTAVGDEPAMNRAFRLWLQRVLRSCQDETNLVLRVLEHPLVERYWQDEAITAVLLSDAVPTFLAHAERAVFEGDGALLERLCFLLRVACQTPNLTLTHALGASATLFLQPTGPGWQAVIVFLLERHESLPERLRPHVAAMLHAWTTGTNIDQADSSVSRKVGLLALHLLEPLKTAYRDNGARRQLLEVVLHVSSTIPAELHALFESDVFAFESESRRPAYARELCKMTLSLPFTTFVARTFPDLVVRLAWDQWRVPDDERATRGRYRDSLDVDDRYGLSATRARFFPASGAKGPFSTLLAHHPWTGVKFIVELCNSAADTFARSVDKTWHEQADAHEGRSTRIPIVELCLPGGTTVKQFADPQLWLAYRGHSAVPYVLQSALMALENWLVNLAEQPSDDARKGLQRVFDFVLRHSNSVLTTAVLASVATGFPDQLGTAALPLLGSPLLHSFDRARFVHELGAGEENWFALNSDAFSEYYAQERRTAALRPWRKETLEHLLVRLQISEHSTEAFAVVETLRAEALDEGTRFLIHRVDVRQWETQADERKGTVMLTAPALAPDLAEIQKQHEQNQQPFWRLTRLMVWATKRFKHESPDNASFASWRDALTEAVDLYNSRPDAPLALDRGWILAAAVFLRDYAQELTPDEAHWCADVVATVVLEGADDEASVVSERVDTDGMFAAASVLPIVLDWCETEEDRQVVRKVIVRALTHGSGGVRFAAAQGIREQLWTRDPGFARACLAGSLLFARERRAFLTDARWSRAWTDDERHAATEEWRRRKNSLHDAWISAAIPSEFERPSLNTHAADAVLVPAFMIPDSSTNPEYVQLIIDTIVLFFAPDRAEEHNDNETAIHVDHRSKFAERLAAYVVSLADASCPGLVDILRSACERAPTLVHSFLLQVALLTEQTSAEAYWRVCSALAPAVIDLARLLQGHEDAHDLRSRVELVRSFIFVNTPWQPLDFKRPFIPMGAPSLLDFARQAGGNRDVFQGLAGLMYHFPMSFLAEGLLVLADWQRHAGAPALTGNTTFYLELSLQRFLRRDHSEPLPRAAFDACLLLLTKLVESASARSYYLREQLVRTQRMPA